MSASLLLIATQPSSALPATMPPGHGAAAVLAAFDDTADIEEKVFEKLTQEEEETGTLTAQEINAKIAADFEFELARRNGNIAKSYVTGEEDYNYESSAGGATAAAGASSAENESSASEHSASGESSPAADGQLMHDDGQFDDFVEGLAALMPARRETFILSDGAFASLVPLLRQSLRATRVEISAPRPPRLDAPPSRVARGALSKRAMENASWTLPASMPGRQAGLTVGGVPMWVNNPSTHGNATMVKLGSFSFCSSMEPMKPMERGAGGGGHTNGSANGSAPTSSYAVPDIVSASNLAAASSYPGAASSNSAAASILPASREEIDQRVERSGFRYLMALRGPRGWHPSVFKGEDPRLFTLGGSLHMVFQRKLDGDSKTGWEQTASQWLARVHPYKEVNLRWPSPPCTMHGWPENGTTGTGACWEKNWLPVVHSGPEVRGVHDSRVRITDAADGIDAADGGNATDGSSPALSTNGTRGHTDKRSARGRPRGTGVREMLYFHQSLCPVHRVLACDAQDPYFNGSCTVFHEDRAPEACAALEANVTRVRGGAAPIVIERDGRRLMLGVVHSVASASDDVPEVLRVSRGTGMAERSDAESEEEQTPPQLPAETYRHAFFTSEPDPPFQLRSFSEWFRFPAHFHNRLDRIQFCNSLDREGDDIVLGYGVGDCEALSSQVPLSQVLS